PVSSSVAGKNRMTRQAQTRWEQRIVSHAACSVFTTPGAERACAALYPSAFAEKRIEVIPNGFDEADFAGLAAVHEVKRFSPLHFVHAGVLYQDGRNPASLFEALANLRRAGALTASDIRVTLRA